MFEVWNDIKWSEGGEVFTFNTLVDAIAFINTRREYQEDIADCIEFWESSRVDNSIALGEWCIEEIL